MLHKNVCMTTDPGLKSYLFDVIMYGGQDTNEASVVRRFLHNLKVVGSNTVWVTGGETTRKSKFKPKSFDSIINEHFLFSSVCLSRA